ncbi:serine/threonine-protein kinase ATR-like [Asterias rubens]|uniref:serine/threonine-protein kinase ATR-like n=1 Tax=Asterias rubens TaxID=7604 RepID=UPI00145564C8|nr:serine/threonine-protein kinase ATR-like [Asterias rubens]XP_033634080.1 serine/threonine-protein kinase ATR-like [Asterias rubens]XP_033634081.1 serine/threonine-protein kinase ATR-like [Asterias rubens]
MMASTSSNSAPGMSGSNLGTLQAALDIMKDTQFSSCTQQQQTVALKTIRKTICDLVDKNTDLQRISLELSKETSGTPVTVSVLNFVNHCIQKFPRLFVGNSAAAFNANETMGPVRPQLQAPQDPEYYICKGLNMWLLSRLMRILNDYFCLTLHDQVIQIIVALLQAVKYKDPPSFTELLNELCELAADVSTAVKHNFSAGERDELDIPLEIQRFIVDGNQLSSLQDIEDMSGIYTSPKSITLKYFTNCNLLQLALTKILGEMAFDLSITPCHQERGIWNTLLLQFNAGQYEVKQATMDVVAKLFTLGCVPLQDVLDKLLEYIMCLLSLRFSADGLEGYEDIQGLELSMARCLMEIYPLSLERRTYCLPSSVINVTMETMARYLSLGGLSSLQRVELREAVCQILVFVYSQPPPRCLSMEMIRQRQTKVINSALIGNLGKSSELQFIVAPLLKTIQKEFSAVHDPTTLASSSSVSCVTRKDAILSLATAAMETTGSCMSSGDERPAKTRRLTLHRTPGKKLLKAGEATSSSSAEEETSTNAVNSATLKEVIEKLISLFQCVASAQAEMLPNILEGIRVALEVVLRSCSLVALKKPPRDPPSNPSDRTPRSSKLRSRVARSNPDILSAWLTAEHSRELCASLVVALQILANCKEPVVDIGLRKIIQIIGSLLAAQDLTKLPGSQLYTFVWMLSIPWLPMDSNWLDLRIVGEMSSREVADLSSSLADKIDDEVEALCLFHLALLPKEIASKWRIHIFKAAVGSNKVPQRVTAVKAFPFLLSNLGANSQHLLHDHVHGMLKDKSVDVLEELGRSIGAISCVICRSVTIHRPDDPRATKPLSSILTLRCNVCHKDPLCPAGESTSNEVLPLAVVTPYLALLSHGITVKQAFLRSFQHIFNHLDLLRPNTAVTKFLVSCLDLIEDRSYDLRVEFSKNIKYLIGCGHRSNNANDQAVVARLKSAFLAAKASGNNRLQETVVHTIAELGMVAEGELLLVVIISLLESLLSKSALVRAAAYVKIQDVALAKQLKMSALFTRFKQPICQFLVEALHLSEENTTSARCLHVMSEVAHVFEFKDKETFLSRIQKILLPRILAKATPVASAILKVIAKTLSMNYREMLVECFRYIFSYLVRTCNKAELEKALLYLRSETDIELGSLMRMDYQSLHNELLLHLSENYTQVFSGLAMLASKDAAYRGPKPITEAADMADFLQPGLLGILAFFDSQLLNSHIAVEDKKLALDSLVCIMKLMGTKHITGVRLKIMATLKIGLRYKDHGFPLLSCRAWHCFVQSVEPSALGPMISQVIVTLLPLLHQLPEQVAKIYNYLIVENRDSYSEHFHELYFMPDIPELIEVNSVLKEHREDPSSQPDLKTQLRQSMKGVTHESLDVRLHALSKLRDLLHRNQSALHEYAIGNETVDLTVTELISVLLSGCRDSDIKAQSLFGECLGELGAVDPGKLEIITNNKKEDLSKFHTGVEDSNFAFDLISELARVFLAAADTRSQDCSAYAIQELLQIYSCREMPKESFGGQLWRRFPAHIKEILLPLLDAKYVPASSPSWTNIPKPIYLSKKGKTYKDWVCAWTGYLVTKVQSSLASRIFKSCSVIIKHDIQTALFLLPIILLYALLDGREENNDEIRQEVLAVLTHAEKTEDQRSGDVSHMSAQTVFSVLDYLTRWKRHRVEMLSASRTQKKSQSGNLHPGDDTDFQVHRFLEQIPQDVLARASFQCKAYARSLMHCEAFINKNKHNLQQQLGFLQKLYVVLDEPDGVRGVSAIRQEEPSLHEQILNHESIGNLRDASACYERAIQLEADEPLHHAGLLRSLMGLGQLNTALVHVNGVLAERHDWTGKLNAYRVEACWKLAKWDTLETHLKTETSNTKDWNIGLGKILLAAKQKNEEQFERQLRNVRSALMGPLSAASMESGSYQRGYEYITRLHMLRDLERGVRCLGGLRSSANPDDQTSRSELLTNWEARLDMTQSSFRAQQPILCLQRIILRLSEGPEEGNQNKDVGLCWLKSAKVARKAGHLQTAYSSILNASFFNLPELCIEKAKWLWSKGEGHQALITLQKGVADHFSVGARSRRDSSQDVQAEKLSHAKALLLVGRFMEETAKFESNSVMKQYKDVLEVNPEWEDGHFYLAKYYDRLMLSLSDRPEKSGEFIFMVVKNFGKSLMYGNQYIYQSMPRLLTLWLDYGALVSELEKGKRSEKTAASKIVLGRLNEILAELTAKLAPYQFLTAFSQLISRICHAHQEVFVQLQEIIAHVLVVFPQQAVWMSMAVSKSSYTVRTKRCHEIFTRAKFLQKNLNKFIQDATRLTDRLLELCNKQVDHGCTTLSINNDFRTLKRLVDDSHFSDIIVPLQSAMTVTLPSSQGAHRDHDPFPMAQIFISSFDDVVEVLPSLQRPKKIGIQGSDGTVYVMMCKPKDDLRQDNRLMEFNGIVNKCLRKDAESRRRQLHIRTYAVIPLNEECGLIEWILNTAGLRYILHKIYKEKGLFVSARDMKNLIPPKGAPVEQKLHSFRTKLLPKFPPVFGEWFLKTFPDPTSWYLSRLAYARTSAVMSMVGYILGLGDRHGENILYDSTTGDCVHVDFNCLFNKGQTFECPERVPFRLTRNMECAMGPMGKEGIFRRACEVTMKVMRDQREPLMSVLKTFIYDPLVEWSKPAKGTRTTHLSESGEINNEKALVHVRDIEQRLQGILKNKNKTRGLPLSIEGHVHYLIQEATSETNLSLMYYGWAAYM